MASEEGAKQCAYGRAAYEAGLLHQLGDPSDIRQAAPDLGPMTDLDRKHLPFFESFRVLRTHLSHRCASFVEDQALHIVGKIGERDLGLGALDADRADEQGHVRLLLRKDMLDPRAYFGFDPISSTQGFRPGFAFGLFAMDPADPAMSLKPRLITQSRHRPLAQLLLFEKRGSGGLQAG